MRQRGVQVIMLVLGVAALAVTDAAAQRRRGLVDVSPSHGRRGFWLEGGLGWGQEAYKCTLQICPNDPDLDGEYTDWLGKPTFSLGLGGTVSRSLRLGVEGTLWVNSYQDIDTGENIRESLGALLAVARLYPAGDAGFFVKGGGGLGVSAVDVQFGGGTSETGFAWVLGAGYEIQLSRSLFITPSVEWFQHSFQKRNEDTLHERLVNLGVRLTWQPGR